MFDIWILTPKLMILLQFCLSVNFRHWEFKTRISYRIWTMYKYNAWCPSIFGIIWNLTRFWIAMLREMRCQNERRRSITGHHDARTRLENHTGTFPLEILPIHRLLRCCSCFLALEQSTILTHRNASWLQKNGSTGKPIIRLRFSAWKICVFLQKSWLCYFLGV